MKILSFGATALCLVWGATAAQAGLPTPRAEAAGYFRVMARPDFSGGQGRLGNWNLHGRLMNEDAFAALELKVNMIPNEPGSGRVWTAGHVRVEGGSVRGADFNGGTLDNFRLSELYVRAGNVLIQDVVWQVGTLYYWPSDLGLYDFRPLQIFQETVGASGRLEKDWIEVIVGVGDSGFALKGREYNPVLTGGGFVRIRPSNHFEFGLGLQVGFEPKVEGHRFAPHTTGGVTYEDFARGRVAENYVAANPGQEQLFYANRPQTAASSLSHKTVFYVGFGGLGPLKWSSLQANYQRLHPKNSVTETFQGRDYNIYIHDLTDERTELNIGNEMQFSLIEDRLDATWAVFYALHKNADNLIQAGEDNRRLMSTVLRLQFYITPWVHLLAESSLAREESLNGNLFRIGHDSIFQSSSGQTDVINGLEFGDTDRRDTFQVKFGPVLNPSGFGIFARPSLRLLVGLQRSSVHNAFSSRRTDTLDEFNPQQDLGVSRYVHAVVGLEAEAWF